MDLRVASLPGNAFTSSFALEATRSGSASGLVIWFDAELSDDVLLSTSPSSAATHWKQTLVYFTSPFAVLDSNPINGTLSMRPHSLNHRGLEIEVAIKYEYDGVAFTQTYNML